MQSESWREIGKEGKVLQEEELEEELEEGEEEKIDTTRSISGAA